MPTKKEIDEIISWCEQKKKEKGIVPIIERNTFKDKYPWAYRYTFIEIDRPFEAASKSSLVYDSVTKKLWHFLLGSWRPIEPEADIKFY
ncbi:MAG: hypothetical protein QW035_03550 [Candidatus Anstonellales archaeon]